MRLHFFPHSMAAADPGIRGGVPYKPELLHVREWTQVPLQMR